MIGYIPYFHDILCIAGNGNNIKMSLLKKTESNKNEKKRVVFDVEVDGEVSELFRETLKKNCNLIMSDEELTFEDFFSESTDENIIISVINEEAMTSVGTLSPVISQIMKDNGSKCVTEFSKTTLNNLLGYAISMSTIWNDKGSDIKDVCIYFRKYQKGSKISKAPGLSILSRNWKTGKFGKVDGDVFKFDEGIDAIYYERQYLNNSNEKNIKFMFVRNVGNFEDIFSFDDFYKQNAQRAYDSICSYENIKIEENLFKKIINNKRTLKKICKLNNRNVFNINFDRFYEIFKTASLNYKFNLIVNGKTIQIENEEAFTDFLDICDSESKLFSDIIDHSKILRGLGKELPKKYN